MSETSILIEEIGKMREALAKIDRFLEGARPAEANARTSEKAIVVADLLAKYYTCLETLFLRVSQHFENQLARERWHADLLDKMALSIRDVRPAVLRDETRDLLLELLKFRHFTRYYYDIHYDWDRLSYMLKKWDDVREMANADLDSFVHFLRELDA